MTPLKATYLAFGIGAMSMGVACLSMALLLLVWGDARGLFGLMLGAFNLYWGCRGLRKAGFLHGDNRDDR